MSQLVRLEGKHTTQNAHCALVSIIWVDTRSWQHLARKPQLSVPT